ncbi:PIN domain-containing protein [Pedobacter gandavensis]|uniref:PIN domain-containing protein n=1 Tax=Pedobacter gandavensis TaxID=2679963 RepID=UPI00292E672C|nr:PIN domain-containing protein [Pedobacter gandavensis]
MINIVLDTNSWLYLCNGYDQETNKHQSGLHFKLLAELISLVERGVVRLFVNDVIIKEFKRNRDVAENHIKKMETTLQGKADFFKGIKKELSEEGKKKVDEVFKELEASVKKEIDLNETHIQKVEDLLFNKAETIPIKPEFYIEAGKLAEDKKAPFHKKNNSVGDALILLSAADFFRNDQYDDTGDTIFVSNNSDDYCASKGSKEVHPDLQPYFQSSGITFELNIGKALNLSQELIAQIDAYNDYMDTISHCIANCKGEELGTNIVVYDPAIEVKIENTEDHHFNPDQLQLDLPDDFKITEADIEAANSKNRILLEFGSCQHCNAFHVRCECGAVNYHYGDLEFECDCGIIIYQDEDGDYCVAREWPEQE